MRQYLLKSKGASVATVLVVMALTAGRAAADGSVVSEVNTEPSSSYGTSIYAGVDFAKDAEGYFAGATMAFNRDLSKSGFITHIDGVISNYDYESDAVPGGLVNGDFYQASLLLGYQWMRDNVSVELGAGVDYQNTKLSPDDPTAEVKGTEVGFRAAGGLTFSDDNGLSLETLGSYSTAFDSYWVRSRFGVDCGRFEIGPEALAFGSEGYDARRLGGFVSLKIAPDSESSPEISASVGHQFVGGQSGDGQNQGGGEGTYVTLTTSLSF